jgi:hypothetical protein
MSTVETWVGYQINVVHDPSGQADLITVESEGSMWQRLPRPDDAATWATQVETTIALHLQALPPVTVPVRLTAINSVSNEVISTLELNYRGRGSGPKDRPDGPAELAKAFSSLADTTAEIMATAQEALRAISERHKEALETIARQEATLTRVLRSDRESELAVRRSEMTTQRLGMLMQHVGPQLSQSLAELMAAITVAIEGATTNGPTTNQPDSGAAPSSSREKP